MQHEWDRPAPRHRYRSRYRGVVHVYQPNASGWNAPIAKKIIGLYWQVTITIIKTLLAIALLIVGIAAFSLLWISIGLFFKALAS